MFFSLLSGKHTHVVLYKNSFPLSPWCNGLESLFQRSVHVKTLKLFGRALENNSQCNLLFKNM